MPVQSRWPFASEMSGSRAFAEMPAHFFTLLCPYLEDAALSALSATCRRMRQLLPCVAEQRLCVELVWERQTAAGNGGGAEIAARGRRQQRREAEEVGQRRNSRFVVGGLVRDYFRIEIKRMGSGKDLLPTKKILFFTSKIELKFFNL